jgi:hypothetical protein
VALGAKRYVLQFERVPVRQVEEIFDRDRFGAEALALGGGAELERAGARVIFHGLRFHAGPVFQFGFRLRRDVQEMFGARRFGRFDPDFHNAVAQQQRVLDGGGKLQVAELPAHHEINDYIAFELRLILIFRPVRDKLGQVIARE